MDVSIPDRVLGIFRPPVPEARVYLVFKVQLRPSKTKVPFQPSACQYPTFHTHSKTWSCKAFRLSVNLFFTLGASNSCCTWVWAEKFHTPILTPTDWRKLSKKYCALNGLYATNTFDLSLTASAQGKKQNTVFLGLDDFVRRGDRNLDLSPSLHQSPQLFGWLSSRAIVT